MTDNSNDVSESDAGTVAADAGEQFRYSVRSLLVATTLFAVATALLKYLSIFGVLTIFVATLIAENIMKSQSMAGRKEFSRGMWGIVMPVLCVYYDPGFLHQSGNSWSSAPDVQPWPHSWANILEDTRGMFLIPPIAVQCLGLACWLLSRNRFPQLGLFMSGFFWTGVAIATTVGICLAPFSLFGLMLFGVGAVGLSPFMTAYIYAQVALEARRMEPETPNCYNSYRCMLLIMSGAVSAMLIPFLFSMWMTETPWKTFFRI